MRIHKRCIMCVLLIICLLSGCKPSVNRDTALRDLSIDQKYTMLQDNENRYYFDDGIYKINKNSGIKTLIHQARGLQTYCLNNGWIYYADGNWDICRVKTNGQDYSVILNAKQFREYDEEPTLFQDEGKLYYLSYRDETCKLMQYNPKDKKVTEVLTCSDFSDGPKIVDGVFYYKDASDHVKQVKIP